MTKLAKCLIILIILVIGLFESDIVKAKGKECQKYDALSSEQKYRLEYSYHYGYPNDLGYTLAAIAWVESNAGIYKINLDTRDYGLHQINDRTIFNTLGVTDYWKKREIITKVITDDSLSAYLAMSVLLHFQKNTSSWKEMVMRYNIGNKKDKVSLKRGLDYYNKVKDNVNILKTCSNFK